MAEIFVRFSVIAFHCWPSAPERRAYLRDEHRHRIDVEVRTVVTHDDREIEFHDLIDYAKSVMPDPHWGPMSCETVARLLGESLVQKYERRFTVSVSEEGEAGATVVSPQGQNQ